MEHSRSGTYTNERASISMNCKLCSSIVRVPQRATHHCGKRSCKRRYAKVPKAQIFSGSASVRVCLPPINKRRPELFLKRGQQINQVTSFPETVAPGTVRSSTVQLVQPGVEVSLPKLRGGRSRSVKYAGVFCLHSREHSTLH